MLRVQKKQCDQCLFSNRKIVDDERKAEVITKCLKTNTHFICHKEQLNGKKIEGLGLCCRGFYDKFPHTKAIGMAKALKIVEFVEVK